MPSACQKLSWISAEDTSSRMVREARDSSYVGPAFKDIDSRFVVSIDDGGCTHATQHLGDEEDWEFPPWEFAEDTVGEGDRWIQMGARFTTSINTEHNAETAWIVRTNVRVKLTSFLIDWKFAYPQPVSLLVCIIWLFCRRANTYPRRYFGNHPFHY